MSILTKEDVLARPIHIFTESDRPQWVVYEGDIYTGDQQFWAEDGYCYRPIRYKGQPKRVRAWIMGKAEYERYSEGKA